jgi:hypothetical protein
VQRILDACERDGLGTGITIDPVAEVLAVLKIYRQAVVDLARIEETADNHAAQVGATRLKLDTALRRLDLLRELGLLPRRLSAMTFGQEAATLFDEMGRILQDHGASEEMLADMQALTERASAASRPRELAVAA